MGQSNEPDPIEWATTAPSADVEEPPIGDKLSGWAPLATPPYNWVNWVYQTLALWVTYFSDFLTASSDAWVLTGLVVTEVPNATQVNIGTGKALAASTEVELTVGEVFNLPAAAGTAGVANPILYVITIDGTGTITTNSTTVVLGATVAEAIALEPWPDPGVGEALLAVVADENGLATYDTAHIFPLHQLKPISGRIIEDDSIPEDKLTFKVLKPAIIAVGAEDGSHDILVAFDIQDADGNAVTEVTRVLLTALGAAGQDAGDVANAPTIGFGTGDPVIGTRVTALGPNRAIFDTDATGTINFKWTGIAATVGTFYLIIEPLDEAGVRAQTLATWS